MMTKRCISFTCSILLLFGILAPETAAYDMAKAGAVQVISAGDKHTMAIKPDGTLWAWGDDTHGQLGVGSGEIADSPVKVMDDVVSVSASDLHTLAIKADGTLWAWGDNYYGQLGNGGLGNDSVAISIYSERTGAGTALAVCQTVPVKVMDDVVAASAGGLYSLALKSDGSLWAWGYETSRGDGTNSDHRLPVKILDDVSAMSAGGLHGAAIKTDGSLWTWGYGAYGQLGDGTIDLVRETPVKVLENVVAVSAGGFHTAAIRSDGSLWVWGVSDDGSLGNGGTGNATTDDISIQTIPIKVMDDVSAVSAGNSFTMAITTDGDLWAFGSNNYGALGNGGVGDLTRAWGDIYQTVPVKVLENVVAVSAGGIHTMAVREDGSLWGWGRACNGRLGNGGRNNARTRDGFPYQDVPTKILSAVQRPNAFSFPPIVQTPGEGKTEVGMSELRVVVDGLTLLFPDAKPYIDDAGRTQIPLRAVSEGLGLGVAWDGARREVHVFEVRNGGAGVKRLTFTIDSPTVAVLTATGMGFTVQDTMAEMDAKIVARDDTATYEMDTVATIRDGRTYIPLSYVAQLLDRTVTWDGAANIVTITSN